MPFRPVDQPDLPPPSAPKLVSVPSNQSIRDMATETPGPELDPTPEDLNNPNHKRLID